MAPASRIALSSLFPRQQLYVQEKLADVPGLTLLFIPQDVTNPAIPQADLYLLPTRWMSHTISKAITQQVGRERVRFVNGALTDIVHTIRSLLGIPEPEPEAPSAEAPGPKRDPRADRRYRRYRALLTNLPKGFTAARDPDTTCVHIQGHGRIVAWYPATNQVQEGGRSQTLSTSALLQALRRKPPSSSSPGRLSPALQLALARRLRGFRS